MDWYSELAALAYLDLEQPMVGKYSVNALNSAQFLINPTVSQYSNIVVFREPETFLYDVKTTILDDGNIELFGRILNTITPFKFVCDKDTFVEKFLYVKNSKPIITKMLRDRIANKKKAIM